jgi:hypothetical protein
MIHVKLFKLWFTRGTHTYDMKVYFGKRSKDASGNMTTAHGTVLQLVRRVGNKGHRPYIDDYFVSPWLSEDLRNRMVDYGTVCHNRKEMPANFGSRHLKLAGGTVSMVHDNQMAICWKDKREVYILSNIHPFTVNGNFREQHGGATKPHITKSPIPVKNTNTS